MIVAMAAVATSFGASPAFSSSESYGLSVMRRIRLSGYRVFHVTASPDGRSLAFARYTPEPPTGFDVAYDGSYERQKVFESKKRKNAWFDVDEIVVVGPGQRSPRRLGYGCSPEFVRNGRALRYLRFTRPPGNRDVTGPAVIVTTDLQTGMTNTGPRMEPQNRLYRTEMRGDTWLVNGIRYSSPGSPIRSFQFRPGSRMMVFDAFGASGGVVMLSHGGGRTSYTELRSARTPEKVLYRFREGAVINGSVFECADGTLLVCDVVGRYAPEGMTPADIRWFRVDVSRGRAKQLSWTPIPDG